MSRPTQEPRSAGLDAVNPKLQRSSPFFRRLTQFSLRSFFLLTSVIAAGCWWWLQPGSVEERLDASDLLLFRQVRDIEVQGMLGGTETVAINSGSWILHNGAGDRFASGRFENAIAHGKWTANYGNGRPAAAGRMRSGGRNGAWRTWYDHGQLRSETAYVSHPAATAELIITDYVTRSAEYQFAARQPQHTSSRVGPATTWHPNGSLRQTGQYFADRKSGIWSTYADDGTLLSRGGYVADVREGEWTERNGEGKLQTTQYTGGLSEDARQATLRRCEAALRSHELARQIAAADDLAKLGSDGLRALDAAMLFGDDSVKLLSLRTLALRRAMSVSTLQICDSLRGHHDVRLASWALVALYTAEPQRRDELREALHRAVAGQPNQAARVRQLRLLCEADEVLRPQFFLQLVAATVPDEVDDVAGSGSYEDFFYSLPFELPPLLELALSSPDRRIRLHAVNLVGKLNGRVVAKNASDGGENRLVSPQYRNLVQRAERDLDESVREAAMQIGDRSTGGFSYGGGFF